MESMDRRQRNSDDGDNNNNGSNSSLVFEIEESKKRCRALIDRIENLKCLSVSCKRTLLRLVISEQSFLSRFSQSSHPNPNPNQHLSLNIGHLEAVVHILEQPFVTGVSRVCKPIPLLSPVEGVKSSSCSKGIYADIVCSWKGTPVWFIVSDRNSKYISWDGTGKKKGLKTRIQQVFDAAKSSAALKPSSIIIFFSNGLDDGLRNRIQDEFKATKFGMEFPYCDSDFSEELEDGWVNVVASSYIQPCILEIKMDYSENVIPRIESGVEDSPLCATASDLSASGELIDLNLGGSFCSIISGLNLCTLDTRGGISSLPKDLLGEPGLINFDTTALIVIVSEISNHGAEKLLSRPESELRNRFKGNYEFVIAQVRSELQNPIHLEMGCVLLGKRGVICATVCSEFRELVSMYGGPNEKLRANHLLNHLRIVPDSPSVRMMNLPTTRKLALKQKVVFGTGDHWHAPTLTANMAFVRAISQMAMSLSTIEHKPRSLTGD